MKLSFVEPLLVWALCVGCTVPEAASKAEVKRAPEVATGTWRLATPEDLARSTLHLSHILVRHSESPLDAPFSKTGWQPLEASTRPKEEAVRIADRVAALARKAPDSFASLARQYSEDDTTASLGGSMGAVSATELFLWPKLLDELLLVDEGHVSPVIETPFGFHVFLRRTPPVEQQISGQRIVIGYAQAPWLEVVSRRGAPTRTRGEAQAIANEVFSKARLRPDDFAAWVESSSEHRDAAVGGDLGVWSNHEGSPISREIELLGQLAPGDIAEPLDTLVGFVVLKRTPLEPRTAYAMTKISMQFHEAAAESDPMSRSSVLAKTQAIAAQVASRPETFDEHRARHCCADVEQWRSGRGPFGVEPILAKLSFGEISAKPIEVDNLFILVKRLDPNSLLPPPGPLLGLPAPTKPDLRRLVEVLPSEPIVTLVQELMRRPIGTKVFVGAADKKVLDSILDRLLDELQSSTDTQHRGQVFENSLRQVRDRLGFAQFETYLNEVERAVAEKMIGRMP